MHKPTDPAAPITARLAALGITHRPSHINGKHTLRNAEGEFIGYMDAQEACDLLNRLEATK